MSFTFFNKSVYRIPLQTIKTSFTENELIDFFRSSELAREGVFLASSSLFFKLEELLSGKLCSKDKEYKKVFISLLKYALRMHNRTTPFGLFSQVGVVGDLSRVEKIQLKKPKIIKVCDLDYNVIFEICKKALTISE